MKRAPFLFAFAVGVSACLPSVQLVPGAQLACNGDSDCPPRMLCLGDNKDEAGLCADAASPCLTADGVPVADGTPCDGGVCSVGICRVPGCGDGLVDVGAGEECDVAVDNVCRDDCTVPFCGDGVVDAAESCDAVAAACQECVFTCIVLDIENPDEDSQRGSNCNLDVSDGCECTLEYLVGEGGEGDDYAWKSAFGDGNIYFTHYASPPTLYRYRADADEPLRALGGAVSLRETGGAVHTLIDESATLARVDGDALVDLRSGVVADEGSDFAIHDDVLYVVTEVGVRASTSTGDDVPYAFTNRCNGLSDIAVCADVLYCSSRDSEELIAIDVADVVVGLAGAGDERARVVATFDRDNNTPTLLCSNDTLFVHDVTRLAVIVPGGTFTELARFPAAGSNFGNNLSVDHDDPGNLFLTLGIGAAGPYAYLYELATGRLTPVARGHAVAIGGGVALTDDYDFIGGIARVRLTRQAP
jgi:hypothetical protein